MRIKPSAWLSLAIASSIATGCASYRVESNIPTASEDTARTSQAHILITEGALTNRPYRELGPIEVSVKKLTIFHANPTQEQANNALIEKARILGADAVINVKYKSGVGFTTWGYIDAEGMAVKLTD